MAGREYLQRISHIAIKCITMHAIYEGVALNMPVDFPIIGAQYHVQPGLPGVPPFDPEPAEPNLNFQFVTILMATACDIVTVL